MCGVPPGSGMDFELTVRRTDPPTEVEDPHIVALTLLEDIGYLPKGYDPKTGSGALEDSVPYRLFMGCFLRRPDKGWGIDELMTVLDTSRPTIYRHLNKLKALNILEESEVRPGGKGQARKEYKLRYGDLSKAWNFVEANVESALTEYRRTVDHLHALLQEEPYHDR